MRRTSSLVALTIVGLAAAAGTGWLVHWSVKRTQEEEKVGRAPRSPAPRSPQAKIIRPRLEAYDEKGKPTWALRLDKAELGRSGDQMSGAGLRDAVIYDPKTGEGVVRVVGDTVSYNLATKNFELTGNVRVIHSDGLLLTMEKASYIEAEKKITCSGRVTGRDKDVKITTDTAFYWPHENVVQCPGEFELRTAGGTRFSAHDLRVDFDTKRATMADASGTINLEEAKSRMERGNAG